jgi:hypothetical protein
MHESFILRGDCKSSACLSSANCKGALMVIKERSRAHKRDLDWATLIEPFTLSFVLFLYQESSLRMNYIQSIHKKLLHIAFTARRGANANTCRRPVQKFASNAILMVLAALRGAICVVAKSACTKPVFRLASCIVAKTISKRLYNMQIIWTCRVEKWRLLV